MAQAIKSPTSARPSALPSKVPEAQKFSPEEQALIDGAASFSAEEQKLIDEAASFQSQQPQQQAGIFQQMMAAPSRTFWTGEPTTGIESFQQGLGQTAELLGAAPVIAGTAIGSVAGPGGALAGSMAGALVQKDVTNLMRKAFGLSANEERSRLLDVAFASLGAIPGLGGQAAMRNVMAGGNASADIVFGGASAEAQATYQSMKAAVLEQFNKNGLSPEQAAEKVAGITSNLQKYVGDYSESGVLKGLAEAFGKKLEVQNKVNQIGESLSPQTITQESMVRGELANSPEKILELKEKLLNRHWRQAYEELKQLRGIETIDSESYIQKLREIRESVKVDQESVQLIDNLIENFSGYQSAVNETRDLGAFARGTGGKTPKYYDMKTGQELSVPGPEGNVPFPETQEAFVKSAQEPVFETIVSPSLPGKGQAATRPNPPFPGTLQSKDQGPFIFETRKVNRPDVTIGEREATYPASEQLGLSLRGPQVPLTAEQKAANLLPPKILENFHFSMMEGIDSLIIKRQKLDRLAEQYAKDPRGVMYGKAAKALRTVEDDFIERLAQQAGPGRQTATSYKMAKEGLYDIKTKAEQLGSSIKQEAFEFADALDSLPIERTKAFAAVMPMEVRQKVLRRYWDNLIGPILGDYEGVLTLDQAKKIRQLYTPERGARFQILSKGSAAPVSNLKSVTDELAKLTMQASKVDPGKMMKSPLFPRLLRAGSALLGKGLPVDSIVKLVSNQNEQAAQVALNRFLEMNFDDVVTSVDRSNSSKLVSWMKSTAGSDNPRVQRVIDKLAEAGLAVSDVAGGAARFGKEAAVEAYRGRTPVQTQTATQLIRAGQQ